MVRRLEKRNTKGKKRKIFIFIIIIAVLLVIIDIQVRPLVKSIAENQAKLNAASIINDEVIGELSNKSDYYSDLISVRTDNNGKILAITTDPQKANILKSSISANIQKKMPTAKPLKVGVPLGTLTGVELLMGRGPLINMKISIPSNISTEIKSDFIQAGINQTKHQVYIFIEAQVYALIPGYPVTTTVSTNILISETVIVGEVPNVYANISESEAAALSGLSQINSK